MRSVNAKLQRCLLVIVAGAMLAAGQAVAQNPSGKGDRPSPPAAPIALALGPSLSVPAPETLLVLIRSSLIALDHANKTGNYSVLRELGGPGLQANSTGRLSAIFATLRDKNVDLSAATIATPQLSEAPSISPEGLLQLAGYLPTAPTRIDFRIVYQTVNMQWRLYGLAVALSPAPAGPQVSSAPSQPTERTAAPPAPSQRRSTAAKEPQQKPK